MINKVILLGNTGADAELHMTSSGKPVMKLRLATKESWKDGNSGERKSATEWHNCVMWGPRAEKVSPHIAKGQALFIEGKLVNRKYQDRDGNNRSVTEVLIMNIKFMPDGQQQERQKQRVPEPEEDDGDSFFR